VPLAYNLTLAFMLHIFISCEKHVIIIITIIIIACISIVSFLILCHGDVCVHACAYLCACARLCVCVCVCILLFTLHLPRLIYYFNVLLFMYMYMDYSKCFNIHFIINVC
jgi:hypothetical protein